MIRVHGPGYFYLSYGPSRYKESIDILRQQWDDNSHGQVVVGLFWPDGQAIGSGGGGLTNGENVNGLCY